MLSKKSRVHIDDNNAEKKLYSNIYKNIKYEYKPYMELIILCIGTDRSTGDSLGPFIGTILKKEYQITENIFGTINNPVHAKNLDKTINNIEKEFYSPYIIAVDAGLGKQSSVGCIDVKKGPLKPGTGVDKELTRVGDIHITGLVNVSGYMEYLVLQSTRLKLIINMAEVIAGSLQNTIITVHNKRTVLDK
ncbi:MAG: spore protease YyaC [Bacillota bacterium]